MRQRASGFVERDRDLDHVGLELDVGRKHPWNRRHHGDLAAGTSVAIPRAIAISRRAVPVVLLLIEDARRRVLAAERDPDGLEDVSASEDAEDQHQRQRGSEPAQDRRAASTKSSGADHRGGLSWASKVWASSVRQAVMRVARWLDAARRDKASAFDSTGWEALLRYVLRPSLTQERCAPSVREVSPPLSGLEAAS